MNSLVLRSFFAPHVVLLKLNRPEKRNALSIALMQELLKHLRGIERETRVLVLMGEGHFFCAGLDLEEAQESDLHETASGLIAETLETLACVPCATLAYIEGGALAGGLGLAAACDLTLATQEARFSLPELRRGLIPALVTALLRKQVPERFFNEMVFTGEAISADRAHALGIINHVISREESEQILRSLLDQLLKSAPEALSFYKKHFMNRDLKNLIAEALQLHREVRSSPEAQEGIQAFLEKRPASWQK
jgi:methylglutaconyl-CoA hydratase